MLSPLSTTAPILNGENPINMVLTMIWFVSSIAIITWFARKTWGD